jgi:hypothetical protein
LNPQQIWPSINPEHEVLLSGAALSLTTAVTSLPSKLTVKISFQWQQKKTSFKYKRF